MNLETYKKLAAEFRTHMEKPMAPFDTSSVLSVREPVYLPGGEKRSMKVAAPTPVESLEHMNPAGWAKHKRHGRLGGRGNKAKR